MTMSDDTSGAIPNTLSTTGCTTNGIGSYLQHILKCHFTTVHFPSAVPERERIPAGKCSTA